MVKPEEESLIISASEFDETSISTLNLEDLIKDLNITIDTSNMAGQQVSQPYWHTTSISTGGSGGSGGSGSILSHAPYNGWSAPNYGFNITPSSSLKVQGDAEIEGDIKWRGRSLGDMLANIERRLAILTPNPEKLAHFESLRKAYEHYKTLEALCDLPPKEEDQ